MVIITIIIMPTGNCWAYLPKNFIHSSDIHKEYCHCQFDLPIYHCDTFRNSKNKNKQTNKNLISRKRI